MAKLSKSLNESLIETHFCLSLRAIGFHCASQSDGGNFARLLMIASGLSNSSGKSVMMFYNRAGKIRSNELLVKGPFVVIATDLVEVFHEVRQAAEGLLPAFHSEFYNSVCACVCVCIHAPCAYVGYK